MDNHIQSIHNKSNYKNNIFKDVDRNSSKLSRNIRLLKLNDDRFYYLTEHKYPKKYVERSVLVQDLMRSAPRAQIEMDIEKDTAFYESLGPE